MEHHKMDTVHWTHWKVVGWTIHVLIDSNGFIEVDDKILTKKGNRTQKGAESTLQIFEAKSIEAFDRSVVAFSL